MWMGEIGRRLELAGRRVWRAVRDQRGEGPASYLGTMLVVFIALMGIAAALGTKGVVNWNSVAQAVADKIGEAINAMKFSDK